MSGELIGRAEHIKRLSRCLLSKQAEFITLCGRRRIGKTYLIKQFFQDKDVVFFCATGEKDAAMKQQIKHFTEQIGSTFYNNMPIREEKNWNDTLLLLTRSIDNEDSGRPIILFFDEFPWMASAKSSLLQTLAYYWNQYWSTNSRIKLIICGSTASWIIEHIVNNTAGLHNRTTENMFLEPFNLHETQAFLHASGVKLNNKHIVELYMCLGGIPYYLKHVERGLSATQVIESLAFKHNAFLAKEFSNLFHSLFKDAETHIEIIKIIASHRYGIGQQALLSKFGTRLAGKGGLEKLNMLKEAGFIYPFKPLYHKEKGIFYKVIDPYILFYLYWIQPVQDSLLSKKLTQGYWDKLKKTPRWSAWAGLSFEAVCYEHLPQIASSLNLSPTALPSTWRYTSKTSGTNQGAQIDLLFDRDDGAITVCEIKYCNQAFTITKDYAEKLQRKLDVFKQVTHTPKQLFLSFVTASGLKQNAYSTVLVDSMITLDDLFQSPL